jgi:hypothetical protein
MFYSYWTGIGGSTICTVTPCGADDIGVGFESRQRQEFAFFHIA